MYRSYCDTCQRPPPTCYCEWLSPVETKTTFVILMHPDEQRRRIATGRMSNLSLKNSKLLVGESFANHPQVNHLIATKNCYLLYPGADSIAAENMPREERTLFILDGKWSQSTKMLATSPNLQRIPRMSFARSYLSWFTIKRQPKPYCLSTIEAIAYSIAELPDEEPTHALHLLPPYFYVINQQLDFEHGRIS